MTAGYFDTFQTKILSGREFTPADVATSQPVAIINEIDSRALATQSGSAGPPDEAEVRPNAVEPG